MKKLTSLLLALIMLFTALTLSGCGEKNTGLYGYYDDPGHGFMCAYESNLREFDIDRVNLRLYYGGIYNIGNNGEILEISEFGMSVPSFELYLENEVGDRHTIKKVEEELISHKYYVHIDWDYHNFLLFEYYDTTPVFLYHEVITIPAELFANDSGYISIVIYSDNATLDGSGPQSTILAEGRVCYERVGDKVVLTED